MRETALICRRARRLQTMTTAASKLRKISITSEPTKTSNQPIVKTGVSASAVQIPPPTTELGS